ncbi:hypothetical protein C7475_11421 [Chitinophaga sp. S165]|nr:hypothetical protein C7475_11421 [Chitinophaga sp. S165]
MPSNNSGQLENLRDPKSEQASVSKKEFATKEEFEELNWLEGTWVSIDSSGTLSKEEKWVRKDSYRYWLAGSRYTLSGKDSINKRTFDLFLEGEIMYAVPVDNSKWPIIYHLSYLSNNGFILEKPDYAFPSKIVYGRTGTRLRVTLSGSGRTESYLFERKGR